VLEGWSLVDRGQPAEGALRIRQGIAAHRASGAGNFVPHFLALLAQAQRRADRPAEAEETVAEALALVQRTGERYHEAELLRERGELLLLRPTPEPAAAERCLALALETARRQQAKSWELRAATSLGRHWRDQGRTRAARDLLAPIRGWFSEGCATPDLQEAGMLLEELGPG
jgi:predicted ATPase